LPGLGGYLLFLSCSLTGGVSPNGMQLDVDIPEAMEGSTSLTKIAHRSSGHCESAYGFISRGNRDGGLKHTMTDDEEADPDDAWQWFFDE
jgi:hypothetical protein